MNARERQPRGQRRVGGGDRAAGLAGDLDEGEVRVVVEVCGRAVVYR
jgi:hypothetical protein